MSPPQKILGFFRLKWLMLVQIQLYFNRNVRLFTARTTTVTCIHVLLAAERGFDRTSRTPLATGLSLYVTSTHIYSILARLTDCTCGATYQRTLEF